MIIETTTAAVEDPRASRTVSGVAVMCRPS
jgi:hypothetical protein